MSNSALAGCGRGGEEASLSARETRACVAQTRSARERQKTETNEPERVRKRDGKKREKHTLCEPAFNVAVYIYANALAEETVVFTTGGSLPQRWNVNPHPIRPLSDLHTGGVWGCQEFGVSWPRQTRLGRPVSAPAPAEGRAGCWGRMEEREGSRGERRSPADQRQQRGPSCSGPPVAPLLSSFSSAA